MAQATSRRAGVGVPQEAGVGASSPGPQAPPPSPVSPVDTSCFLTDTNIAGGASNLVGGSAATGRVDLDVSEGLPAIHYAAECQKLCQASDKCTHFTYASSSTTSLETDATAVFAFGSVGGGATDSATCFG